MTLCKPGERTLCNIERIPCDKVTVSAFWFVSRTWETQKRWNLFMPSISWRNRKQDPHAMQKCQQRTLHKGYGLPLNIEEMASAKSLVWDLPRFESSCSEVLPSVKRLHHFFTVEKTSASVSETDLRSAVIGEARRPLSVRKRITAHCSLNIRDIQTRMYVLKTSAGADVVEATKIFEREIGEEEIVCRIQSFITISAHHWVRQRRRYVLFDLLICPSKIKL
jgi:hypothetical protein